MKCKLRHQLLQVESLMAKNTMTFPLLQNFISQEEMKEILAEFGFEDMARKCDVPTLLAYLIGTATFE